MEHLVYQVFPPHSECWMWRWDIILTHFIGDILIVIAYYAIPFILFYLTRKYTFDVRLNLILWIYSTFIFLCGTTHLFDIVMIWYVDEAILIADGWLRVITGVFSIFSAFVTFYAVWKFLSLAEDFFGITTQLTDERRNYTHIEAETWKKFESSIDSIKQALNTTID